MRTEIILKLCVLKLLFFAKYVHATYQKKKMKKIFCSFWKIWDAMFWCLFFLAWSYNARKINVADDFTKKKHVLVLKINKQKSLWRFTMHFHRGVLNYPTVKVGLVHFPTKISPNAETCWAWNQAAYISSSN